MSRIRSVYPEQWTDEDFVECSMAARLLALGLRNEADDNGIFEWRPTRLKMRLFPADAIDVGELLDELVSRRMLLRYDLDGRTYGAIRNFRVYQNPRSPKSEHPVSPEADAFVGARAGEETPAKRSPGRPRKQQTDETNPSEEKSFPQSVEKNSEMERRVEEDNYRASHSSISELTDAPKPEPPALVELSLQLPAADDVQTAFDEFDQLRRCHSPGCRSLDFGKDRRKHLALRLREIGGLPEWRGVLAMIRGSPFLRGETSRSGFVAVDWLLKPQNLRKVREGNYRERTDGMGGSAPGVPAGPIDAFAVARSLGGFK